MHWPGFFRRIRFSARPKMREDTQCGKFADQLLVSGRPTEEQRVNRNNR
jgi:hypothetical protein